MQPIYTAFYTEGTRYEEEAKNLRASLRRLNLEYDIRPIPTRGSWAQNAGYTATHICNMLAFYPDRPVVQLDCDAVVVSPPTLFDGLQDDIAVHWRRGRELLNGTVWFNATPGARMVAEKYRDLIASHPNISNEQTMLDAAIKECSEFVKVFPLPAGFCYIPDIMEGDLAEGEKIVVQQHQASREETCPGSDAFHRRRKWLAELNLAGVETA